MKLKYPKDENNKKSYSGNLVLIEPIDDLHVYCDFTIFLPELVRPLSWTCANILRALDSSGKLWNEGFFVMTRAIFSQDSANWWFMHFIVNLPRSCLSSFDSSPEQVPTFYCVSTVLNRSQTKIVSRWLGQTCPEIRATDGSCISLKFIMVSSKLIWL